MKTINQHLEKMIEEKRLPHFIFIHGYGNSSSDFKRIKEFEIPNLSKEYIELSGHEKYDKDFEHPSWNKWCDQVQSSIDKCIKNNKDPYLIGYSIGASISIYLANNDKRIKGVIGISTFLGYSNIIEYTIKIINKIYPSFSFKRRFGEELDYFREEGSYSKTFKVSSLNEIRICIENNIDINNNNTKFLFIHSLKDEVANFHKFIKKINKICTNHYICCLHEGDHFLISKINNKTLFDMIFSYFDINISNKNINNYNIDNIKNRDNFFLKDYELVSNEHRFWADLLFKTIIAFLVAFGTLIYQTLPEVLLKKTSAPYYIFSYWTVIMIYLILSTLYFFYMNRTQHYIINYFPYLNFYNYKSNKYMSGSISLTITPIVSVAIIFVPILISIFCAISIFTFFGDFLDLKQENYVKIFWFTANSFLSIFAITALISLRRYEKIFLKSYKNANILNIIQSEKVRIFIHSIRY